MKDSIQIWTDGASRGNPGPGAFAVMFWSMGGTKLSGTYGTYRPRTTNNEMELSALVLAMQIVICVEKLSKVPNDSYDLYSDSAYTVNGYNDWVDGWVRYNQIDGKANKELWRKCYDLKQELSKMKIKFNVHKVAGHAGVEKNEAVDAECNRLMDKMEVHRIDVLKSIETLYQLNEMKNFSTYTNQEDLKPIENSKVIKNFKSYQIEDKNLILFTEDKEYKVEIPIDSIKQILKM